MAAGEASSWRGRGQAWRTTCRCQMVLMQVLEGRKAQQRLLSHPGLSSNTRSLPASSGAVTFFYTSDWTMPTFVGRTIFGCAVMALTSLLFGAASGRTAASVSSRHHMSRSHWAAPLRLARMRCRQQATESRISRGGRPRSEARGALLSWRGWETRPGMAMLGRRKQRSHVRRALLLPCHVRQAWPLRHGTGARATGGAAAGKQPVAAPVAGGAGQRRPVDALRPLKRRKTQTAARASTPSSAPACGRRPLLRLQTLQALRPRLARATLHSCSASSRRKGPHRPAAAGAVPQRPSERSGPAQPLQRTSWSCCLQTRLLPWTSPRKRQSLGAQQHRSRSQNCCSQQGCMQGPGQLLAAAASAPQGSEADDGDQACRDDAAAAEAAQDSQGAFSVSQQPLGSSGWCPGCIARGGIRLSPAQGSDERQRLQLSEGTAHQDQGHGTGMEEGVPLSLSQQPLGRRAAKAPGAAVPQQPSAQAARGGPS